MKNKFTRSGGANHKPFKLSEGDITQLEREIGSRLDKKPDSQAWRVFIKSLEFSVSMYLSHEDLKHVSSPAITRENLKELEIIAHDLYQAIEALDTHSEDFIESHMGRGFSEIKRWQENLYFAVCQAGHDADELPKKGKLPQFERGVFAKEVVRHLYKLTGITPRTTKEGVYESVLGLALSYSKAGDGNAPHALLRKAIAQFKLENNPSN